MNSIAKLHLFFFPAQYRYFLIQHLDFANAEQYLNDRSYTTKDCDQVYKSYLQEPKAHIQACLRAC